MRFFHLNQRIGAQADSLPAGARELDPRMGAILLAAQNAEPPLPIDFASIDRWEIGADDTARMIAAANRQKRNDLLAESDWTQMPDTFQNDPATKRQWVAYRQQLRDLDFTGEVQWPVPPSVVGGGPVR